MELLLAISACHLFALTYFAINLHFDIQFNFEHSTFGTITFSIQSSIMLHGQNKCSLISQFFRNCYTVASIYMCQRARVLQIEDYVFILYTQECSTLLKRPNRKLCMQSDRKIKIYFSSSETSDTILKST